MLIKYQDRFNALFTGVLIIMLVCLLCWASSKFEFIYDWTHHGRHTLSSTSQEIVGKMDEPLEITAYAREQKDLRSAITRFVEKYQRHKTDIILRFINPDAVPDELRQLGVNTNGEMVLHYRGKREHVRTGGEEEFSNALLRLMRGTEHWLAFIEGHGERNPLGKANHDYGELGLQLSQRGFTNQPVNLMQLSSLPDNTSVLVIAGPLTNYLTAEVEKIINFVHTGGNLLWLAEPNNIYGLDALAEYLGVKFPTGTVIDISGQLVGIDEPTITLITDELYPEHPALVNFDLTTLFPRTGSLVVDTKSDWTSMPLLKTGDLSWHETDNLEGEVNYDEDLDTQGPLTIAYSFERQKGNNTTIQRVVVMADSDFISNSYIGNAGNLDLGIRLLNWLTYSDEFIQIPSRVATDRHLDMSQVTAGIIGFGFLLALPLLFLSIGITLWWRRKNL